MLNKLFGLRCPVCGKPISEDDSICSHCGTNMDTPLGLSAIGDHDADLQNLSTASHYLEIAQQAYDANGNLKDALYNCDLAIQYSPKLAKAYNLRGLILDAMGRTEAAINSYQEAIQLDPLLHDARSNLKDAEAEIRQRREKQERWDKILPKVVFGCVGIFMLICIVIAGSILYKLARPYFEPKINIVLEPDYTLVSTVDPLDLEAAMEILNERSQALGYKVPFTVTGNNQIIASVPESINVETFLKGVTSIGLLEFVDFGEISIPTGTIIVTDFEYPYFQQTDEIRWHTVMTNSEMRAVDVSENGFGQYEIAFTLTPVGAQVLAEYTTNNVGNYLGLVLDKRVVSSPRVNSPITEGTGAITGQFTKEEAEALAVYLKIGKPLPIPLVVKDISPIAE